jgi:hypothetical protein
MGPACGASCSDVLTEVDPVERKNFSPGKKPDPSKHFGKVALAHYIQANAANINKSGLDEVLLGLNAAVAAGHAVAP